MKHICYWLFCLLAFAPGFCQHASLRALQPETAPGGGTVKPPEVISVKVLKFEPVDSTPSVSLPPVTSVPQCDSNGTLYLDMLNPKELSKHEIISIHGNKAQTYTLGSISDVHDAVFFDFSASENEVVILVRGTQEVTAGTPGAGKSPAGYPWSSYHNFLAVFKSDGSYKGAIEMPVTYQLSHLAVLPSGDFLVAGYDRVNSAAKLLLLDESGRLVKTLDMPVARTSGTPAPFGSIDAAKAARAAIGSVSFTPYGKHMLVLRRGSNDPILDVGPGGSIREVPLQVPAGFAFVDMVPANDRWVAHFRSVGAPQGAPFTEKSFIYEELRPQDASIASELTILGDVPQSLACEDDGTYLTYKMKDTGKMAIYSAR